MPKTSRDSDTTFMLKEYYLLTKPGIIYSNTLATIAGFLLAAQGHIVFLTGFAVIVGTAGIIASACVFNNITDKTIDALMQRTKKRALVTGTITPKQAFLFAILLGIVGFAILGLWTNLLTVTVGLIGFIDYVFLYGFAKRTSVHGTLVGSISGAMPPIAGYVAITNHVDSAVVLLFLIWVCWQMVHFYAIALYRKTDYQEAGVPVLPVVKGLWTTRIQMLVYTVGFILFSSLMGILHYTGMVYLFGVDVIGLGWFGLSMQGFVIQDSTKWARKMFYYSLFVMLALCILIATGSILP